MTALREIVLLTRYQYPANWESIAHQVRKRDGNRCVYCGRGDLPLHVDHIWPLSRGGTNDPSNLRTLCEDCHTRRHPSMWRDPYWRGRLDQREVARQWTAYFANIKASVLQDLAARTGLPFAESRLSPKLRQNVSEIGQLYYQYYSKCHEVQNLNREKGEGIVAVIGLSCLGIVLLLSGAIAGVVLPEAFRLGFYSIAIIGAGLIGLTSLMYLVLVKRKERLAGERERESLQLNSLIQARLGATSKEIQDELTQ